VNRQLQLISETVLSGSAASVTFSSIPATFRSLALFFQARTDRVHTIDRVLQQFNSDSGSNYDFFVFNINSAGTIATAVSRATTSMEATLAEAANSRASSWSPGIQYILGYSRTDREKFVLGYSGTMQDVNADTDLLFDCQIGRWRDSSAISGITLLPSAGTNFVSGSIFTLYGIL
jgi:hypothetical protein